MKRSPLKRSSKPMKRTQLKRSGRLRPVSKRTAKLKREVNPKRAAYVQEMGKCACCDEPAVECHEIAAGSSREKALRNRFAWLAVCRRCHEKIQGAPVALQLAYKAQQDSREFFDIEGLNFIMGKAPTAVEAYDVIRAAMELRGRS